MDKQSTMYYRTKVLFDIAKLVKSDSIALEIVELIMNAPSGSKESTAEDIVKKMENCQTEEEVIEVLGL